MFNKLNIPKVHFCFIFNLLNMKQCKSNTLGTYFKHSVPFSKNTSTYFLKIDVH